MSPRKINKEADFHRLLGHKVIKSGRIIGRTHTYFFRCDCGWHCFYEKVDYLIPPQSLKEKINKSSAPFLDKPKNSCYTKKVEG